MRFGEGFRFSVRQNKALEHHAEVMEAIATGLLRRDGVEL